MCIFPRPKAECWLSSEFPGNSICYKVQFRSSSYRGKQTNIKEKSPFCIPILSDVAFAHMGGHSSSMLLPCSFFPNTALMMKPALALPHEKPALKRKVCHSLAPTYIFYLSFLLFQIPTNTLLYLFYTSLYFYTCRIFFTCRSKAKLCFKF